MEYTIHNVDYQYAHYVGRSENILNLFSTNQFLAQSNNLKGAMTSYLV